MSRVDQSVAYQWHSHFACHVLKADIDKTQSINGHRKVRFGYLVSLEKCVSEFRNLKKI